MHLPNVYFWGTCSDVFGLLRAALLSWQELHSFIPPPGYEESQTGLTPLVVDIFKRGTLGDE